jgi:hypothetical protein
MSKQTQRISEQAVLRLIAPGGEVYETETGFVFTSLADGNHGLLEAVCFERDFVVEAIEVEAGAFHYSGSLNCSISMRAGDTLTLERRLKIDDRRRR